jgi:hypothetical protein
VHGLESKYGNCVDFVYLDADNAATKNARDRLGYRGQPDFFLLDATGKVVWKKTGTLTVPELENELGAMLMP